MSNINGLDLVNYLKQQNIFYLYHANTVKTSISFLRLKTLLSRGYMNDENLIMSPQKSDDLDQKFNIWYDIFLDYNDLHYTLRRFNFYGPVLFRFNVDLLSQFPPGIIYITKDNPQNWQEGMLPSQKYFSDLNEFSQSTNILYYKKMITLKSNFVLPDLLYYLDAIFIDFINPTNVIGNAIYQNAFSTIKYEMLRNNINLPLQTRMCSTFCNCQNNYATLSYEEIHDKFMTYF